MASALKQKKSLLANKYLNGKKLLSIFRSSKKTDRKLPPELPEKETSFQISAYYLEIFGQYQAFLP